jgi:hypothetical protein
VFVPLEFRAQNLSALTEYRLRFRGTSSGIFHVPRATFLQCEIFELRCSGINMSAKIEVSEIKAGEFQVRVSEGATETAHQVTVSAADYNRYAGASGVTQQELVRRSFEFLLEHEPKESILGRFQLNIISRYFPQFEKEIQRRLVKK